ncbi:MAG: methyltransferase, TrmA family [Chitinophagaceae bacterium]|nr:methyltransferase, TrmA family [Chitinophagaceae bacterium]
MSKRKHNIILEDIKVENYAAEGKALARHNGKVIFMEGAVPGDVVNVQLTKSKKDWAEGRVLKFKEFSKERVQPFCQHFGTCGGCQWQMLPYELQLKYKQQQVIDNIQRIGKIPFPASRPIVGCAEDRRYRNKLEYTFSNKKYLDAEEIKNPSISAYQEVAGYHVKGWFDKVIEINVCHLQEEPTNGIRKFIADYARGKKWPFYDIRMHIGFLRTMQVRLCTTGELMVNIVFADDDREKINELCNALMNAFPAITTLLFTINTKMNDSIYDLEPQVFSGKGYVTEKLEDFIFKIGPKSFFQTNTKQAEALYGLTRQMAQLTGKEILYDLYCGTGSIGIFCSKNAGKIIGVEAISEAVEDAKINAALNNVETASFFTGDVIEICDDDFFSVHGHPDVIITDPPRAGMHEKLVKKLLDTAAPLIVYVSCNPATQARDLNLLGEKYSVEIIQPVDMFPHTHHIENIAQLKLK